MSEVIPRINVAELKPKQDIESTFNVKYINIASAKDGKKYLNVILADGTGDLESRAWNNAEEIYGRVERGNFVQVKGKVNIYQGRKQFIIQEINKLKNEQIDMSDFVMKARVDSEIMYTDLLNIVSGLSDVYIKDLLNNILNDTEIARRLKLWQAGKSIHHAYQGGLLEHILSCTTLAVSLSKHYHANVNYVVAGCVLHDLCKIYELTDGINVEYTEEGKLVGHLVKILEVVDRFSYRIDNFPYQMKLHLKHILLSHHGEYEYGSPKIPQSTEAYLVHLIDLMDSKMNTLETIKRTDNQTGHWSSYVKHMDRIVYKGDLPFYSEYVTTAPSGGNRNNNKNEKPKKTKKEESPKTNLGSMLKDFKVD